MKKVKTQSIFLESKRFFAILKKLKRFLKKEVNHFFDPIKERISLLDEIKTLDLIKKNNQIMNFIHEELEKNKITEKPIENNFCQIF